MRRRPPDVSGPGIEVEVVPGEAKYFADAPALAEQQGDGDPHADRRCGGHELASVSGTQRTTFLQAHRPGRVHQVERVGGDQSDLDRLGEDLATGLATAEHGVRSKPIQQRRLPRRQYLLSDVGDTHVAEPVDEVRNRLPVGRERRLTNLVTSNRLEPRVAQLLNTVVVIENLDVVGERRRPSTVTNSSRRDSASALVGPETRLILPSRST